MVDGTIGIAHYASADRDPVLCLKDPPSQPHRYWLFPLFVLRRSQSIHFTRAQGGKWKGWDSDGTHGSFYYLSNTHTPASPPAHPHHPCFVLLLCYRSLAPTQAHMSVNASGADVDLGTFPATHGGVIDSFGARYPAVDADLEALWRAERPAHSL